MYLEKIRKRGKKIARDRSNLTIYMIIIKNITNCINKLMLIERNKFVKVIGVDIEQDDE